MRLSIKLVNDEEVIASWDDVCGSPQDLLNEFIRRIYVDTTKLNSDREVVVSNQEPGPNDRSRIWISSVEPIFIAGYVNGQWRKIYQYPVGTPLRWLKTNKKPNGMRNMADHEVTAFGYEVPPLDSEYEFVIFTG